MSTFISVQEYRSRMTTVALIREDLVRFSFRSANLWVKRTGFTETFRLYKTLSIQRLIAGKVTYISTASFGLPALMNSISASLNLPLKRKHYYYSRFYKKYQWNLITQVREADHGTYITIRRKVERYNITSSSRNMAFFRWISGIFCFEESRASSKAKSNELGGKIYGLWTECASMRMLEANSLSEPFGFIIVRLQSILKGSRMHVFNLL